MSEPKEKILFIWSQDSAFVTYLKKKINTAKRQNRLKKQDYNQLSFWSIVNNKTQFKRIDLSQYDKIVVLAELVWKEEKHTTFYGLEVIRMIRFEKSAIHPILLVSFLNLSQLKRIVGKNSTFSEIRKKNILNLSQMNFEKISFETYFFSENITKNLILNHFYTKETNIKARSHRSNLFTQIDGFKLMLQRYIAIQEKRKIINNKHRYSIFKIRQTWKKIDLELKLLYLCYLPFKGETYDDKNTIPLFLKDYTSINNVFETKAVTLIQVRTIVLPSLINIWRTMFNNLPQEFKYRIKNTNL